MTKEQKEMKRYMTAIERRLNLPREVKVRVMRDLQSTVQQRREAGQTDAEIYAEMGTSAEVAAELNEQMKEYAYAKSKWRWAALAVAVAAGVMLLFEGLVGLLILLLNLTVNEAGSLGIIGGADGPTSIFVTGVTTTGYGDYAWILWLLVAVVGLLGWWKLGHIQKGG